MSAKERPNVHWFFAEFPQAPGELPADLTFVDAALIRHLKTVMRARPGEKVILVNPAESQPYLCTLLEVEHKRLTLSVESRLPVPVVSGLRIRAAVSLIKGPRWDWLLQKLTELGVWEIIPLVSKRTIIDVKDPTAKQERWEEILKSAAEQSEQVRIPKLHPVIPLGEFLQNEAIYENCLKLVASERSGEPLYQLVSPGTMQQDVVFAVGPEGGWEPSEIELLQRGGFQCASLGDKIFRSETAALYLATVIHHVGLASTASPPSA